jgi:hypothetical protein
MKTNNERYKKRAAERGPVLSKTLEDEFLRFLEYHPAGRFTRNLRKMLLEFLMTHGADEGLYLNDLLYDLEGLFELLDCIETEMKDAKG